MDIPALKHCFIGDTSVLTAYEISKNLVGQRMKTINLAMKNNQNIGSEETAKRHAFMHSMFESCHLNSIRPIDYFTNLFQCYQTVINEGKIAMLPCYYTNKILKEKFQFSMSIAYGVIWDIYKIVLIKYLRKFSKTKIPSLMGIQSN